jgi:hypothetical protein
MCLQMAITLPTLPLIKDEEEIAAVCEMGWDNVISAMEKSRYI